MTEYLKLAETRDLIRTKLYEKADRVVENARANGRQIAEAILSEMRDAPDNSKYPLSRRAVERLLSVADYHIEGDEIPPSDTCEDGKKKVLWFPFGNSSDWQVDAGANDDIRPAMLQPYDYQFSVYKGEDINKRNPGDIEDNDQVEFKGVDESVGIDKHNDDLGCCDNMRDAVHKIGDHAVHQGGDLVLGLADGNEVFMDPHTINHLKTRNMLADVHKSMGSIDQFQAFLNDAYGKAPAVGHAPAINPVDNDDLPQTDQQNHRDSFTPDQF